MFASKFLQLQRKRSLNPLFFVTKSLGIFCVQVLSERTKELSPQSRSFSQMNCVKEMFSNTFIGALRQTYGFRTTVKVEEEK